MASLTLLRFFVVFFILFYIIDGSTGFRNNKSNYESSGRRNDSTSKAATKNPISAEGPPEKPKGRSGISAWGIVALIISVILLCMGSYYSVLFYPLLCTKERKYDVIDLSV